VLVLVIATTIVHSDEYSPPSGPYVGAGWGQFDLHLHNLNDVGIAVTDITHSNDDAWKAFVGFRFAPFIGVEAADVDFGHPNDTFQTTGSNGIYHLKMTGFSPAVIGTIPLGPVEIFGNAGYYFYNLDTRVDFSSGPFLESRHSRSDSHRHSQRERFERLLAQSVMALLGVDGSWQRLARAMQMSQRTDSGERPIARVIQRSG
jgi:OmpA-like transmembrane domain